MIKTHNPTTDESIKDYDEMTLEQANDIISDVHNEFKTWKTTSFEHRAGLMNKVADILENNKDEYANLMTDEMGKLLSQGVMEIEKCAAVCRYYADNAEEFLEDEHIETELAESFVTYQPIGVILAVMPWNFPFWQAFRYAVPTLMAGNVCVLKHASNVTGCSLMIEKIFADAGFPKNAYRALLMQGKNMEDVIGNDHIRAVTLTGSEPAGKAVASAAAKKVKKSVLELGGSDPYIILEDADLDLAVKTCVQGRLLNAGQTCIAAKRFIVVEKIYDDFVAGFEQAMSKQQMGDPRDENSALGAMSSKGLRDDLHDQVERSIKAGAKCILGGEIPDKDGAWYPPSILINVTEGMPAYDEELFGPVASVIKVKDEDEAIKVANDTSFGLGGAVFTQDINKALDIARTKIDTGNMAINGFVKSNPALPFGGVKNSGYGRELSYHGIHEFVNAKTVTME